MKSSHLCILGCAVAVAGAIWGTCRAQPGDAAPRVPAANRVAICDVVVVFNEYQKAKDLTQKLDRRRQEIQAEGQRRSNEIDSIRMTLEGLRPGSKKYRQEQQRMEKLQIERDVWAKVQKAKVMRDHYLLTKEMYNDILRVIRDVADQHELDLVLYRELGQLEAKNTRELLRELSMRKVLYSKPSVNITDLVLKRLNARYKAEASG